MARRRHAAKNVMIVPLRDGVPPGFRARMADQIVRVKVVGGGAAGFFAAITCEELAPGARRGRALRGHGAPAGQGPRVRRRALQRHPRLLRAARAREEIPARRPRAHRGVPPLAAARHDRVARGARRGDEDRGGRPDVSHHRQLRDDRRVPRARGRESRRARDATSMGVRTAERAGAGFWVTLTDGEMASAATACCSRPAATVLGGLHHRGEARPHDRAARCRRCSPFTSTTRG